MITTTEVRAVRDTRSEMADDDASRLTGACQGTTCR